MLQDIPALEIDPGGHSVLDISTDGDLTGRTENVATYPTSVLCCMLVNCLSKTYGQCWTYVFTCSIP